MIVIIKHNSIKIDQEERRFSLIKANNKTRELLKKELRSDFSMMANEEILEENLLFSFELDLDEDKDEDI